MGRCLLVVDLWRDATHGQRAVGETDGANDRAKSPQRSVDKEALMAMPEVGTPVRFHGREGFVTCAFPDDCMIEITLKDGKGPPGNMWLNEREWNQLKILDT
jgi:hypothetical protein